MAKSGYRIYHNPRCTKSRQTLELLQKAGIEPEIVDYLKNPPSTKELEKIAGLLKGDPMAMVRTKEERFKELGLDKKPVSGKALYKILHENPVLIERPIVVKGQKAVIGRPPENVKELL